MADDEKKRTQEASETNFTTRGGRQDETSGAGKPQTSPCKRGPAAAPPADDAATVVGPPLPALTDLGDAGPLTLERALQGIRPLTDCCSARDLLILSCLSTKTAACATPAVDMDSPCHVRLGPSQRDAFGGGGPVTKGGGVLAYIDALFWLAETTQKATR